MSNHSHNSTNIRAKFYEIPPGKVQGEKTGDPIGVHFDGAWNLILVMACMQEFDGMNNFKPINCKKKLLCARIAPDSSVDEQKGF